MEYDLIVIGAGGRDDRWGLWRAQRAKDCNSQ